MSISKVRSLLYRLARLLGDVNAVEKGKVPQRVERRGEDEPRYATVAEIAARLEPHPDATMLLTAVSEAVERYDPSTEAVILLETESGFQVLILISEGREWVGGFEFAR
jgi:hypothetical protein